MAKYRTGRKAPMVDLTAVLREVLEEYGLEVTKDAAKVLTDLAPEIVTEVKSRSPEGEGSGGKHYADGWKVDRSLDNFSVKVTVYNENKPTLTHLLEYGHRGFPKKDGGRTRDVQGKPHIKKTSDWAEEETMRRLERVLEK